ncbi:MAG TPA: hypothetical protein VF880_09500, partial [Actinomycetes bacterium]
MAQQVDPAPAQRRPPYRSGFRGPTVSSDRAERREAMLVLGMTPEVVELRRRVAAFMDEHVYP